MIAVELCEDHQDWHKLLAVMCKVLNGNRRRNRARRRRADGLRAAGRATLSPQGEPKFYIYFLSFAPILY